MVIDREAAFNNISRSIAITRYDIEQRQAISDFSLNIHGENFFRDVFNFVFDANFINANFDEQNIASIDLVDHKQKMAYQITTTRATIKMEHTLNLLRFNKKYKDYTIRMYYLLEKAKPQKKTIDYLEIRFGIDMGIFLNDYTDLIKEINNLEESKLIELNKKYFSKLSEKYTDEIILDLVLKHIISNRERKTINYDDLFGSIETREKIKLNGLNERITSCILRGLDFSAFLNEIENNERTLTELRELIVYQEYQKILKKYLSLKIRKTKYEGLSITKLNHLAFFYKININKALYDLKTIIEQLFDYNDFNTLEISWIIISYFFEICDIGEKNDTTQQNN